MLKNAACLDAPIAVFCVQQFNFAFFCKESVGVNPNVLLEDFVINLI